MAASIYERDNYEMSKTYPFRRLTPEQKECYLSWRRFKREYNIKENIHDAIWHKTIVRPEPPEDPTTIVNWGKDIHERKFPYLTSDEKKLQEARMDEKNPHHEEYLEWYEEEWRRRKEGFFFYNGSKLEYITGNHYMFLQYWLIPVTKEVDGIKTKGLDNPIFKDVHRDVYYCLKQTKEDSGSCGVIYLSMRRIGKTILALSDMYWDITNKRSQKGVMQSKNEPDARKLFKKVISSWKHVPRFFKPNDNEDSDPQTILWFGQSKKKSKVEDREYSRAYINSSVEYESSKEEALDGEYYSYVIHDEIGKAKSPLDVNARWEISKECVMDGSDIIGFAYLMSTVEDMEKYASDKAKLIWDSSDAELRDPVLGRTASGLYQLFLPAYYGLSGGDDKDIGKSFVDEWGYSNIKEAFNYVSSMYKFLKGEKLRSFMRKYPITIDDAFNTVDAGNNFSKERLVSQRKHNEKIHKSPVSRGNFQWKDGIKNSEVVFYPDEAGLWEVSWMPPPEDRNRYETRGRQRYPTRGFMRIGIDPVQQSVVREGGSMAGAVGILKHHAKYPDLDNGVVCTYLYRQEHPELFFDDMVKMMVFYSSPVMVERNKEALLEYMRIEGWNGFAMTDPLETDPKIIGLGAKGIPTTSTIKRNDMMESAQAFIYDNVGFNETTKKWGYFYHNNLIKELLGFTPNKWTDFDLVVAFMLAVIALKEAKTVAKVSQYNTASWFKTFV